MFENFYNAEEAVKKMVEFQFEREEAKSKAIEVLINTAVKDGRREVKLFERIPDNIVKKLKSLGYNVYQPTNSIKNRFCICW